MLTIIVAHDKNLLIGNDNKLPWHIPEDLKHFKRMTKNKKVVMGRKTFESIISYLGKPLPDRETIVLTRDEDFSYDGVTVENDYKEIIKKSKFSDFIIAGGTEIYKLFIDHSDFIIATEVDKEFTGDSYFPEYKDSYEQVLDMPSIYSLKTTHNDIKYSINLYSNNKNKDYRETARYSNMLLRLTFPEVFVKGSRIECGYGWKNIILSFLELVYSKRIDFKNNIKSYEKILELLKERKESQSKIEEMEKRISELYKKSLDFEYPKISQIKSKFAQIRIYYSYSETPNPKELDTVDENDIINYERFASKMAVKTCESCGNFGKMKNKNGFLVIDCGNECN